MFAMTPARPEIRVDHPLIGSLSPLVSLPESAAAFTALAEHIGWIMHVANVRTELLHLRYLCESVASLAGQNTEDGERSSRFS